jgi:hypothetical protein
LDTEPEDGRERFSHKELDRVRVGGLTIFSGTAEGGASNKACMSSFLFFSNLGIDPNELPDFNGFCVVVVVAGGVANSSKFMDGF